MRAVGDFLSRFKNLKAPERSVRAATIEAVSSIIGVNISDGDIKVNNTNTLYISTSSTIKAAIFENKKTILSRLNNNLNKDQIKDIK